MSCWCREIVAYECSQCEKKRIWKTIPKEIRFTLLALEKTVLSDLDKQENFEDYCTLIHRLNESKKSYSIADIPEGAKL